MVVLGVTGQLNHFIYRPVEMEDHWVTIPPGEFQMGSSDEEIANAFKICPHCDLSYEQPQHLIYLEIYQTGKNEITNRQYARCVKAGFALERLM